MLQLKVTLKFESNNLNIVKRSDIILQAIWFHVSFGTFIDFTESCIFQVSYSLKFN